jgi:hypothetical protein
MNARVISRPGREIYDVQMLLAQVFSKYFSIFLPIIIRPMLYTDVSLSVRR